MIPRGEMRHWDLAVEGIAEPALETDVGGPAPEQHPANVALHERLVLQAREIRTSCPDVWAVLDGMTRPRAHLCALMQPSLPFGAAEHMAYNLGLDAVGVWLRALAEDDLEREVDDGEE